MNHICLLGRLTDNPVLRSVSSGISNAKFTLAVNRPFKNKDSGENEADFIDITCWRGTADFVGKYFTKGQLVAVEGRLEINSYTDQQGVRRRGAQVVASQVHFAEPRRDGGGGGNFTPAPYANQNQQNQGGGYGNPNGGGGGGYPPQGGYMQGNHQPNNQQPNYNQGNQGNQGGGYTPPSGGGSYALPNNGNSGNPGNQGNNAPPPNGGGNGGGYSGGGAGSYALPNQDSQPQGDTFRTLTQEEEQKDFPF